MWSRRAQEYEAKISSGKIYDLAEVVRDLNKGDDLMIDQSYSERQLFEKAYDRLLTEFQIVMGTNLEDTQKKLDKALKRLTYLLLLFLAFFLAFFLLFLAAFFLLLAIFSSLFY